MTIMQERSTGPTHLAPATTEPRSATLVSAELVRAYEDQQVFDDYIALRAAAVVVNSTLPPEQRGVDIVQSEVGAWLDENAEDMQASSVYQRIQRLTGHLSSRHMGRVRLFELDATNAFVDTAKILERKQEEGEAVDHAAIFSGSLIENAPALAYVPEDNRAEFISGLPRRIAPELHTQPTNQPDAVDYASKPSAVVRESSGKEEKTRKPEFGLRSATAEDIPQMVEIDLRSFSKVYEGHGLDAEALRSRLTQMFAERYQLLGGKWMPVVTRKDENGKEKIAGFMISCPTSKTPDDFVSWEQITNEGRLDTLYDPKGKNAYVVTLSMDPAYRGERGQDQLYTRQMGNLIAEGLNLAFFESRMPGFRAWTHGQCRVSGRDINKLTDDEKMDFAQTYSSLTREVNGREVPYDSLLRLYTADFGCKLIRVVPNAYNDKQSMDFGALYTFENPMPRWIRDSKIASRLVGGVLRLASKSTKANNKLMKAVAKLG